MNLPGCALGPSVGPSQVVTGAVDASMRACAAASPSLPAWAVITGAATVIACAPAAELSNCVRPPRLSTVPAANPACLKKLLRVEPVILTSWSFLRRERALPAPRGIGGQTHRHNESLAVEQRLDEKRTPQLLKSSNPNRQDQH